MHFQLQLWSTFFGGKVNLEIAKDNSPYFVLTASNAQTIGTSEMYSSTSAMESVIRSVKSHAPTAAVKDLT